MNGGAIYIIIDCGHIRSDSSVYKRTDDLLYNVKREYNLFNHLLQVIHDRAFLLLLLSLLFYLRFC